MAWDPDKDIPDGPLRAPERRDARRVLKWFERRAIFHAGAKAWAVWIVGVPTAMIGAWQIVQMFMGHVIK